MFESFSDNWKGLISNPTRGQVEIRESHPLRVLYGTDGVGQPILIMISEIKPPLPSLSDAVRIKRGKRTIDSLWALSLTLTDPRFSDVFIRLGEDLVRQSSSGANEHESLSILFSTVGDWKELMTSAPLRRLSKEAVRGLIAELWVGYASLEKHKSAADILTAWTGPEGRPQDYCFGSEISIEVKSVYPDARTVKISSAAQLDPAGRELLLAVVTLVDVTKDSYAAVSLVSIISSIEDEFFDDSVALKDFHRKLSMVGVDASDSYYSSFWVEPTVVDFYRVASGFPSIRESDIAVGVESVSYSITLASISSFKSPYVLNEVFSASGGVPEK